MNKRVPVADVVVLCVTGTLLYLLGTRTHIAVLEALGGFAVGLGVASLLVGFSILQWLVRKGRSM